MKLLNTPLLALLVIATPAAARVVDATTLRPAITANEWDEMVIIPAETSGPLGVPGSWTLVFSDEFEGTTIDAGKWSLNWLGRPGQITPPVNSAEIAAFDPAQCRLSGTGEVLLNAIRKTVVATDDNPYDFVTCLLSTHGKFETTFGAFEARVWMPGPSPTAVPYNWGAFWGNGRHRTWPDRGENDVMENLSGGPTWHYHFGSPDMNAGKSVTNADGWSNSWHVFGCVWTASGVTYYYDGKNVGSVAVVDPHPKYWLLQYALSTQFGGPLSVPQTMKVDWVHVFKPASGQPTSKQKAS